MSAPTRSRWLGRRYLFSRGRLRVPSYTAMLYLGCVAGVFAGAAVARAQGLAENGFVIAALALLLPALAGARLWYVLQNIERYRAEPSRIWRRAEGGMTLYGGMLLSVLVSIPGLALAHLPFWSFWDAAAVMALVGLIFTRVGCVMNGCCAGRATSGPLGVWLPNHQGEWRRRYPTAVLETGWGILVLAGALAGRPALPFPGALFMVVVAAYAAGRMVLEPTRETHRPERTVWVNLVFSALLLAGACAVLISGLAH